MSQLKKHENEPSSSAAVPTPGEDPQAGQPEKTIWDTIDEIWAEVPDEDLRKLPADLAAQHDHYIYGLPKKAK